MRFETPAGPQGYVDFGTVMLPRRHALGAHLLLSHAVGHPPGVPRPYL